MRDTANQSRSQSVGLVIHSAARYDFIVWLFTMGRERKLREKILRLAHLRSGETVLDIGCGTGTLAILAKREVGKEGAVYGVDAAAEMVARGVEKARRARVDVALKEGLVQDLPIPDASIDVVLSTFMLHHVPGEAREQMVREVRRVLKPGGRILAVDFSAPSSGTPVDRFHRHGFTRIEDVLAELEQAGLTVIESGEVGAKNVRFALASLGLGARPRQLHEPRALAAPATTAKLHRSARPFILAAIVLGGASLIALHVGAAASLPHVLGVMPGSVIYLAVGALALILVLKIGFFGLTHRALGALLGKWIGAREETLHRKG